MKGKMLQLGAKIGIVAPASYTENSKLYEAKKNLENLGFEVVLGSSTLNRWHSYSDTDENRAKDINEFFKDSSIDAIMCMRGGYGSNRLVEYLDLEAIRNNPKIFIGYSDITTLHILFNEKLDLITFHGPMAVSNFLDGYSQQSSNHLLNSLKQLEPYRISNFKKELKSLASSTQAVGKLVGGNLTTLIATLGTEYDLNYEGKILFLEEICEPTYKIDRHLNHLKKYGVFEKINGIILGNFKECNKSSPEDMSLEEVFQDYFSNLNIPVIADVESGHSTPMLTLPLGAMCKIDSKNLTIDIVEGVVGE